GSLLVAFTKGGCRFLPEALHLSYCMYFTLISIAANCRRIRSQYRMRLAACSFHSVIPRIAQVLRVGIYASGMLLLAACAGQDVTQTGFLSKYDDMQPTADHTDDLIYVAPEFSARNYTKVIIEPIVWQPAPGTPARDPEVVAELQAAFHEDLVKAFSGQFIIIGSTTQATMPGPGVLRVRAAITNTRRANWYINAPVQLVGLVGIPAPPPDPGGATEEMEVIDAQSGNRLVSIVTYNNGMPWNVFGYYETFGHARRAFSLAATLLREQVDKGRATLAAR
ncbi:MAG: DUF3313 domain-containing protein, partial [Bradyrhizobium sp.]|nr:DUF3313 domain-containing protein [Bradyrhizobium sp.]